MTTRKHPSGPRPRSPRLDELRNLGPKSRQWLAAVGVTTRRQLAALGPIDAYLLLHAHGYPVSLNLVYAIAGGLQDLPWNQLPGALRDDLRTQWQEARRPRCAWSGRDINMRRYHDEEWGVPVHDDRRLFEFLILEGAQAGLNWSTILNKRDNYRRAFDDFDPRRVARYDSRKIARLLKDPGIVRNRLKIQAAVGNAQAFLKVQKEFGSFDEYLWGLVDGRPIRNRWQSLAEVPARTAESDALSRDLQGRGFRFVGSTICYAFMQAVGVVNDHTVDCFRHDRR